MSRIKIPQLAKLVRQSRQAAGISLYELAKRSGINRSTLLRIEDGDTTEPDAATLNALARGLGVDPERFYDAVWRKPSRPLPSPATYFRSKYRLSPEQIAKLEASIKQMARSSPADKRLKK